MYAKRLRSEKSRDMLTQYSDIQCEPSLVPILVESLLTGNPGGRYPQDVFATTLINASEETYKAILAGWESMPSKVKKYRYPSVREDTLEAPWIERLSLQSNRLLDYRRNRDQSRRKLMRREFSRALAVGPANWQPSEELQHNRTLSYLVQKNIWSQLATASEKKCCNRLTADEEGDPNKKPNYGIKLTKITCHENDESFHDEIYAVSVVVDGKGKLQAETSAVYSMNDGDDNVVYPNKWLYAMNNPESFLDSAIDLWEDDGNYENAAKAVAALGIAIAAIPGGGVTQVAGIALASIGGLIALASWLDIDDKFGVETKTWVSDEELKSGVGPYVKNYINYDTGYFDFTSYNYELQLDLLTAGT
jgi:quercetin dioxygenase-like cupin family protein